MRRWSQLRTEWLLTGVFIAVGVSGASAADPEKVARQVDALLAKDHFGGTASDDRKGDFDMCQQRSESHHLTTHILELPRSAIRITVAGFTVEEPDLLAFSSTFLSVWERIDASEKDAIHRHWGQSQKPSPRLELQHPWLGDKEVVACTGSSGREIKFCWEECKLLRDKELRVLIAHEMGHVYQFAIGKHRFNMKESDLLGLITLQPLPLRENGLVEIHADELVIKWGFDPILKDAYFLQYFDRIGGKLIPRKSPKKEKRAYNEAKEQRNWSRYVF